jgi:hypothetical protein
VRSARFVNQLTVRQLIANSAEKPRVDVARRIGMAVKDMAEEERAMSLLARLLT